jgi:hypothetical protein
MWFKKKSEVATVPQPEAPKQDFTKLFNTIFESMKITEHRLSNIEIELDSLKIRLRKKIVDVEEKKDINTSNELAI